MRPLRNKEEEREEEDEEEIKGRINDTGLKKMGRKGAIVWMENGLVTRTFCVG
ncbi:hypothetical protein GTN66_00065 [bacterium]|nr:hypothetical protein [bacterium]NIN91416.1 hypothetical protein [bacterium]NIO17826.1 hypothetical protein [bacterium]NIO72807.1 hypothetical protein [bacterium]